MGVERGLLAPGGALAQRWGRWVAAMLVVFTALLVLLIVLFSGLAKGEQPSNALIWGINLAFVGSAATSCLAFIALALRFARPGNPFDRLSPTAYGMYLTHYALVSWLQYALLGSAWPGALKGMLVFLGATLLSWGVTRFARSAARLGRVL
jgi:peptidoglycan/LPS O-acetylase OafA/YrhL